MARSHRPQNTLTHEASPGAGHACSQVWRIVGSPVGAALFRFARRKPFLASFSKKNLFADPALVAGRGAVAARP